MIDRDQTHDAVCFEMGEQIDIDVLAIGDIDQCIHYNRTFRIAASDFISVITIYLKQCILRGKTNARNRKFTTVVIDFALKTITCLQQRNTVQFLHGN